MKLFVTRPRNLAERTAARLETMGHTVLVEPLLDIKTVDEPRPDGPFDAIALTSQNAIAAAAQAAKELGTLQVFTTGHASAEAAKNAGFSHARAAGNDVRDLAKELGSALNPGDRVLYPRAHETAFDLAADLSKKGIICLEWIVYEAVEAQTLSDTASKALESGDLDLVLLYSPRTARCFSRLIKTGEKTAGTWRILALSDAIRKALDTDLQQRCIVSENPNEASLFGLIDQGQA